MEADGDVSGGEFEEVGMHDAGFHVFSSEGIRGEASKTQILSGTHRRQGSRRTRTQARAESFIAQRLSIVE